VGSPKEGDEVVRKMFFTGLDLRDDEWLALAGLLFPPMIDPETNRWLNTYELVQYYCDRCDSIFKSLTTPTKCPRCGHGPGPQANTVTLSRYGVTIKDKVFPFFAPYPPDEVMKS
jgi:hypothetical protein